LSSDSQLSLDLPAPPATGETPLVPARMVNEWVYCPRLAWLEWTAGEWAESGDTAEGRRTHARVDQSGPALPAPDAVEAGAEFRTRAVTLSSERLGLIAKLDLLEGEDGGVTIVDYKKGKRPHVAAGVHDPERVQLCAQALVLEENGYRVDAAFAWFAESRERVPVVLDEALRAATKRAISELRLAAASTKPPPPLDGSPKCVRCSLAGICLPDEVNFFRRGAPPRPLNPSADTALPLYVQTPGARVRKDGDQLVVESDAGKIEVPIADVSQLVVVGPVSITTPTLHELMRREIPVTYTGMGGWLLGHTVGVGTKNVGIRIAQYRASFDATRCLRFARSLTAAKIRNQRSLLRRNWKDEARNAEKEPALDALKRAAERAEYAEDLQSLLGFEGEAAAVFFRHFEAMLVRPESAELPRFDFDTRTRRPPRDPVNAMLSFGYALLSRLFVTSLSAVGFDPYCGFYHQPRFGRPALALDMMEPFRPVLADSVVLLAINNGELKANDFIVSGQSCALKPPGRKAFIAAFERRLDQETTHPLFGYRVSMRRLIEVQCRLLARWLQGEIADYPHYLPR